MRLGVTEVKGEGVKSFQGGLGSAGIQTNILLHFTRKRHLKKMTRLDIHQKSYRSLYLVSLKVLCCIQVEGIVKIEQVLFI